MLRQLAVLPRSEPFSRLLQRELQRQEVTKQLQRRLEQACRELGLRYVNKMLENWLLQSVAAPRGDPVLGGASDSPAVVSRELIEAGAPEGEAHRVALEMCEAAAKGAGRLKTPKPKSALRVQVADLVHTGKKARLALIERGGRSDALQAKELTVAGAKLRINKEHLDKLRELHAAHGQPGAPEEEFLAGVACLLLRYSALQGGSCHGGGMQAALTEEAFGVLHERLGATVECFASPLNCFWRRHCSAFPDIDCAFGSLGSFFSFWPKEGSFQANPPFEACVIKRMAEHIHELLERATGPMSFCVFIPAWESTEGWQELRRSAFLAAHMDVPQKDHGFCEGLQHSQPTRYRIATFDTSVFVLQNPSGGERWPPSPEALAELRGAMRSKHSTVAQQMAAKQRERGPAEGP